MKIVILGLILLATSSVFASQPNPESVSLGKILLHMPLIADQLKSEGTVSLYDVEVKETVHGVNVYELKFERNCFCIPKIATVSVTEDLRPTFADGAPIYTGSVIFSDKR